MTRVFEAVAKDGVIILPAGVPAQMRCLVAVMDDDFDQLHEDATLTIPESSQRRMGELLQKNRDGELTEEEGVELDALGHEFDNTTLRKGRALGMLAQLEAR